MRNKFLGTGQPGFHPLRKLRVIAEGFYYAVAYDFSVAYKVVLSVVVLATCAYLRLWLDLGLVLVATGAMLSAEMFNTTIEALCDFVETQENQKIKVIKDVAAAATGLAILVWFLVVGAEGWNAWHALSGPLALP